MKDLIESGVYEVDLEEPTPLEKKAELINTLKVKFYGDLLYRDVPLVTIDLAWELSEDRHGEDEALNSLFLFSVVNYIEKLEEYVTLRINSIGNKTDAL